MEVEINQIDHVHLKVTAERWLLKELWEYFSFFVPGYQFMPAYKNKIWNGKIYLFNLKTQFLYVGLLKNLIKFCKERNYNVRLGASVRLPEKIEIDKLKTAIKNLNLPFEPRDYQVEGLKYALENKRGIILSPTGSGKSLIIYMIMRMFNKKSLLIVPTQSLVHQMYGDFEDYSSKDEWNHEENCHQIYSGKDKFTEKQITISTWQSIYKMPKEYFEQFDVVIGDECFDGSTKIKMADGSEKRIDKIKPGDDILTLNEETFEIQENEVVKLHENISPNEKMYKINFDDGTSIEVTGNHKIYDEKRGWVRVDKLEVGDYINSIR